MKNSIRLLITFYFSFHSFFSQGQAPAKIFDKSFGGSGMYALDQTTDGGFILGGIASYGNNANQSEPNKGFTDYWIVKTDAYGTRQWDADFGGDADDYLNSVKQTSDGGYILGGYSLSGISGDKTQDTRGQSDYWIVKTDANGHKQWDARYGGSSYDYLTSVEQTSDGGYILGGYSSSGVSGDKTQAKRGYQDYWIVKVDANGVKQWDKRFGGDNTDELFITLQTPDGGYILGGDSYSGNTGDKTQPSQGANDYWIVKTDANGVKLWDARFGGINSEYERALRLTTDGGFILGGYSNSGISGDKTQDNRGNEDYWMVKVDGSGIKQWDARYGGSGSEQLFNNTIWQTSDQGYVIGGWSDSGISFDKTQAGKGMRDFWIIKTDANGAKLWDADYGGTGNDYPFELQQTPDNGFIIGGFSDSPISGDKTESLTGFWILKTDFDSQPNTLSCGTIVPLTYSAGESIEVPYTVNGVFAPGNVFTAQLSDFTGSFISAVNIGSIASTTSGVIAATIPSNLPYGVAYRIRVVSSIPAMASNDNGQDITIGNFTGPTKLWDFRYGGNAEDNLHVVARTSDGGYINGGESASPISGDKSQPSWGGTDYWIVKSDMNGTKQWDARFGGFNSDYLYSVQQTDDQGYILGGFSYSPLSGDKTEGKRGNTDYWIVKADVNGVKQWDHRFGGTNYDQLYSVLQTGDGGYLLVGQSNSDAGADKLAASKGGNDVWVVKTDGNGVKQWDFDYGGSDDDYLYTAIRTSDGGYLLGAYTESPISGDVSESNRGSMYTTDYWLVKINAMGVKQWDARFGGSGDDYLTSLQETSDGGFIVGGYSNSPLDGDKSQTNIGGYDYWVVKTDMNGVKQWDKRFGTAVSDQLFSVMQTPSGNFILGGSTSGGVNGDKTQPTQGQDDFWIIKTDSLGEKIWDADYGGSAIDDLQSALITADGNYLFGGYSFSGISGDKSQPSQGNSDYWLLKINAVEAITCDVPAGEFTSAITGTTAKANWNAVTSANKYKVRYRVTGTNEWTKITATNNYKKLKSLAPSTAYDWQVESVCSDLGLGNSDWSSIQNFITDAFRSSLEEEAILTIFPNPFSSSTTISFTLEENSHSIIGLYDLAGRKLKTLLDENLGEGNQTVMFNRESLTAGIYFLQLKINGEVMVKKVVIE